MKNNLFWLFFLLLTFVVTLPLSWWGLAKADFFYPVLHDSIGIDKHIEKYAPKNQLGKTGFEKTSKPERVGLFHGIVEAIHDKGDGLEGLTYTSGQQQIALLTEAEILHLKDVAILLEKLKPVVITAFIIWIILLLMLFLKKMPMASAKQFLLSVLVLLFASIVVLSFGPEKLFNQLHIWAFPDNHQWFFYYEESLMSTMMKAPDLFGYIAAIWVLISSVMTAILIKLIGLKSGANGKH